MPQCVGQRPPAALPDDRSVGDEDQTTGPARHAVHAAAAEGSNPNRPRIRQRMSRSAATTTRPTARPTQLPPPTSGVQKPRQMQVPSPARQYPTTAITIEIGRASWMDKL